MLRDEFSDAIKRTLSARVGHQCSNPDCRAATSGPQVDNAKALNLGVAAHIAAAATGGPRYDRALTPAERAGIGNGIWLCQNCAKLIDNDPARYPADVIAAWKLIAEHHALHHVGKTASGASVHTVEDKWVDYGYIEAAGILDSLKADGFAVQWVHAPKQHEYLDLKGWKIVEHVEEDGRHVRFKVRELDCEYMILLKRKG